jgi:hypothetical protein
MTEKSTCGHHGGLKADGTACGSTIINKETGRCRFHPNTNVGKKAPAAAAAAATTASAVKSKQPAAKSQPLLPVAAKKPNKDAVGGLCQAIRKDKTQCTNDAKYGLFCGVHNKGKCTTDTVSGGTATAHAPPPRPASATTPTQESQCSGDSHFTEGEIIGNVQCLGKVSESVFCQYYSSNGIRCSRHVARFRNIQTKKEYMADHCMKVHHSAQTPKEREERMRIGQDTVVKTKLAAVAQFK